MHSCSLYFSNNVLNHSTGIIKSVASLSLYNPWSTLNRNNNYVCQMYGSNINESSIFKVWYDSISDVERADVSVLDDVIINVRDGYKQCDLSKDEILLTIVIICTNCKSFKQCALFSNLNKDVIIILCALVKGWF